MNFLRESRFGLWALWPVCLFISSSDFPSGLGFRIRLSLSRSTSSSRSDSPCGVLVPEHAQLGVFLAAHQVQVSVAVKVHQLDQVVLGAAGR